ncbi:helix-turn-helix domain-containing protein [Bordetella petrii]|uniref:helix-turn-helix domain-containing protein n=1 Tax=Bordetella petrii TaxID=94624 RepID=UPI001E2AE7D3|nr:XRE family transcriptional regulator [Bordetella petrii]MCD0503213.1 XRE family transcriptional regulator [Bordetella petrii]
MNNKVNERIEFVARQLGARIRKARQAHRITLEGLSQETGLSAGFLSRLERGEASASISNLIAIATHLDIPLRDFFEEPEAASPDYVLYRANERAGTPALAAHGYTYRLSSGDLPDQQMSAFELSFPPDGKMKPKLLTHEGEEVLYLLEGTIEFQIADDAFVMKAGDCVHFNCSKPHMGRNVGKTPARLLMVVTPAHSKRT